MWMPGWLAQGLALGHLGNQSGKERPVVAWVSIPPLRALFARSNTLQHSKEMLLDLENQDIMEKAHSKVFMSHTFTVSKCTSDKLCLVTDL